jgi:uncharacterized protein HemX
MTFKDRLAKNRQADALEADLENHAPGDSHYPALEAVLADFRATVVAWSDAEFARARVPATAVRQRSWRVAAGWVMGCVLIAGAVGGGGFQQHQHKLAVERDRLAKQQLAEQQKVLAEQRAIEEEDLLANVDSDVSREVPSAMEPLAQLMSDDESK